MKHFIWIASALAVSAFTACKKTETVTVAPASATLQLTVPVLSQTYHYGDTVLITGSATFDAKLHGYKALILRKATGDTLFQATDHTHATSLSIRQSWVDTLQQSAGLTVLVAATVNHEGTEVSQSVAIQAVP